MPQKDEVDDDRPQAPDVSHLTTEDDQPVDNMFQDKQCDILVDALRVSWEKGRPFLSAADVGIFPIAENPAIVPDVLLSVGVEAPPDAQAKESRSYFIWKFGKPPEIVIEIVSNRRGGEDTSKLEQYARIKVPYYVIYDPGQLLSARNLRIFQLNGASYVDKVDRFFPEVGLGLTIWEGSFDHWPATWLRWVDDEGRLLETGEEVKAKAVQETARADQEKARADKLAAKLRELGVSMEEL